MEAKPRTETDEWPGIQKRHFIPNASRVPFGPGAALLWIASVYIVACFANGLLMDVVRGETSRTGARAIMYSEPRPHKSCPTCIVSVNLRSIFCTLSKRNRASSVARRCCWSSSASRWAWSWSGWSSDTPRWSSRICSTWIGGSQSALSVRAQARARRSGALV